MIVVPSMDIREGRVVRFTKGRLEEETAYPSEPAEAARLFEAEGAARLHIVDLDAMLSKKPQLDAVAAVIEAVRIPVAVEGGLSVLENAMRYRQRGADRVVFTTAALGSPGVVEEAVRQWGASVAIALRVRGGQVTFVDWNEITSVEAVELAAQMKARGVCRILYTEVPSDSEGAPARFGRLSGFVEAAGVHVSVGGIASLEDLARLGPLEGLGVDEALVGKALYEKQFSLADAARAVGHGPENR
jgi:phosphoribosylformimino-5-aminoimidazole carboxamide ribotide isomerase